MAFTKNGLAIKAMTEMGEDTSNSDLADQYEEWVQDAFDKMGILTDWKFTRVSDTITLVGSTRTYQLEANADDVVGMWIQSDDHTIIFKDKEWIISKGLDLTDEEALPQYWYWEEGIDTAGADHLLTVGFYQTPSTGKTVSVIERGHPAELATGDKIPAPRSWEHVMKAYVVSRAYLNEGLTEDWQQMRQEFLDGVALIMNRLKFTQAKFNRLQVADVTDIDPFPIVKLPADYPG